MKAKLNRSAQILWHVVDGKRIDGVHKKIRGNVSGIWGDVSSISGNVSGIRGNVSGIRGEVDSCELSEADRNKGVDIADLIETALA